jgi:hypothetical protein
MWDLMWLRLVCRILRFMCFDVADRATCSVRAAVSLLRTHPRGRFARRRAPREGGQAGGGGGALALALDGLGKKQIAANPSPPIGRPMSPLVGPLYVEVKTALSWLCRAGSGGRAGGVQVLAAEYRAS